MSQPGRLKAARSRVGAWWDQARADVKESLDPGLLRVLRFFGLIYGRIDRRSPIDVSFRNAMQNRGPSWIGWRHALGGISYLLFLVLVVTGVLLALYYRPAVSEAYASIQHITSGVRMGWLMRDLHVWSANLIVVAVLAHMARVFVNGAYLPPRETNWFVGLFLLALVLAFGATGYLLPWDQWAYWTTAEALDSLRKTPLIGGFLVDVLTGDAFVSGATLSRFFAIHVIVLPWLVFALLAFHFSMVRVHGPAPPVGGAPADDPGKPFYPHFLLRSFGVSVFVLAVLITLAALYPRPVGEPAAAFQLPEEIVSTWIVVDVSRALLHYLGPWGLAFTALLGLSLALIPLFDRRGERPLRQRRVALALTATFFLVFLTAWLAGRQLRVPPAADLLEPAVESGVLEEQGLPIPEPGPDPIQPAPSDPSSGEAGR
jgi:quinol-cytochrome oxidoreductase complex cytochrome b subunit